MTARSFKIQMTIRDSWTATIFNGSSSLIAFQFEPDSFILVEGERSRAAFEED